MGWAHLDSPLFSEWLELAGGKDVQPCSMKPMGPGDALVVIDMQKDFVPGDAKLNPDGGRFGVPEGDNIVLPIVDLIQEAAKSKAVCVATRDYHPVDHVSFIAEGGPFPEHCVQGTPGAEFMPPIAGALAAATVLRPNATHVAFKAFHEDVDSFGGLPYIDGGEQRLCIRESIAGSSSPFCVGCAKCPWSGSIIVKQSAITAAARRGEVPNMDAPPDMLCVYSDDSDAVDRGQVTLEKRLAGCTRLFVCGLALDFCVLDTCLNARKCGFEQVG